MAPAVSKVTVRDYKPADHDVIVPMWKNGFAEMGPHEYRRFTSSAWPFIVFASLGSGAALVGWTTAAKCLVGFGAAIYTPFGKWLLNSMLWTSINIQAKVSMGDIEGRWMQEGQSHFFVAEYDGRPVGCVAVKAVHTLHCERNAAAGAEPVPGEASIWRLTVDPNARKLGIGKLLMSKAEGWASEQGCKYMTLVTANPESKLFYRRLGYAVESQERARKILFGDSGVATSVFGGMKSRFLERRLNKETGTVFMKQLQ